jgi:hypothetical protein
MGVKLVSDTKRGAETEGVREQGAEEIFGQKRDEMTRGWRKLHNVEFHISHSFHQV